MKRITAARKKTVKLRKNGKHAIDAASTMTVPTSVMRSILRPQVNRSWMMPYVASYTPVMVESILRGALSGVMVQQWELFRLMLDTWPALAACKEELLYGISRRELQFDPYAEEDEKPTPNAIEREKLVTEALRNMQPRAEADENGLDGTIEDLMDAWFRGISVCEVLWFTTDTVNQGLITAPRATKFAHPCNYAFGDDGVLGLTDDASYADTTAGYRKNEVRPFPPYKFLTAIHKAQSGSPIGGALLRPLAWWWCAANFSSDWLLNLAQIFGLPFRWANYAASAPDETVAAVCNMLQNMGSAGWAAFPEGTSLELKEAAHGSDRTPQGDLLDRADAYVRLLILGQTMTGNTLASGRGGQSFGTVEAQLKQDRLDAASFFISNIFNRQLIPYILQLNYGDAMEAPRCRFLKETEGTYQDAQRDQILTTIGLDIPLSYLRHKYSVPSATNDEPVAKAPITPIAPSSVSAGPKGTRPLGEPSRNGTPNPKEMQAKLERISAIEDEEVFAIELNRLADDVEAAAAPAPAARTPRVGKSWHSRPFITKNAADDFASRHPGTWVEEAMTGGRPNGWAVKLPISAGDFEGHPFHGNQYTEGMGGAPESDQQKKNEIRKRGNAMAERMGFPTDKIDYLETGEPVKFNVGDKQFVRGGFYSPSNGRITIDSTTIADHPASIDSMMAHEVSHAQFDVVKQAQELEHARISTILKNDKEFGRHFTAGGFVRPESKAYFADKFPVSTAMARTWGDSYLEGSGHMKTAEMIKDDGISDYSKAYWAKGAVDQNMGLSRAVDETVAEVNSWQHTGAAHLSRPSRDWEQFARDIRVQYKRIKHPYQEIAVWEK